MVTIKRITRSQVEFDYDGRTAIIEGEGLLPGHGSPDFILYENTLNNWASPHEAEAIDEVCKETMLLELLAAFRERGMTAEIE